MNGQTDSTEIWRDHESGWLRCKYGDISLANVLPDKPGRVEDVGPLILVTVPFERDTINLARYGIDFTVTDGIARMHARNGTWWHRLQPAHWRAGMVPNGWSPQIMLGQRVQFAPGPEQAQFKVILVGGQSITGRHTLELTADNPGRQEN
ncbi:Uncharacterised protein [Mycobacteroides abscessus subsp. abscessus]|uniref:hypothetical protein n=1 Tax=Mycobacteroides abscessus TaxID=36809 RepID=UPI0009294B41|nr:hypothetical protein [Mycobacteroides abscessus]SHU69572.1 Uncharacterised protein [Mycobacteroides abscessus subsp. abscessus]